MMVPMLVLCLAPSAITLFPFLMYFVLHPLPMTVVSVSLGKRPADLTAMTGHGDEKAMSLPEFIRATTHYPKCVSLGVPILSIQMLVPRALISARVLESQVKGTSGGAPNYKARGHAESDSAGLEMFTPIIEPPNAHVTTTILHEKWATPVKPLRALDAYAALHGDVNPYKYRGNKLVLSPFNLNVIPSPKQLGATPKLPHVPHINLDQREKYELGERGTPGKLSFDQQVMDEGPATTGTLQALSISLGQEVRDGSNHNPESVTM
ncbi:uncharacterized protein PG998_010001 [Apiospora kogelbergensis]|uniref:uncharacterized protein n=1 Tax=Apiospora kogelbergensis TaxID=1337665 RepID=UPI0031303B6C